MAPSQNETRSVGEALGAVVVVGFLILMALGLLAGGCYALPKYRVWQQGLEGQSELARAEYNRKVKVAEAEAAEQAAIFLAKAEVERAKGVAQANEIIGSSLKGNEAYLRYLWIQGLQTNQMQTVYIPTEAGLPILEAGATSWRDPRSKAPEPAH